jgi:hypothetical protein
MRAGWLRDKAGIPRWPLPGTSGTPGTRTKAPPAHPLRRRLWLAARVLLALAVLLGIAGGILLWRLSATVTSFPGPHFNRGENAVWLEHHWAGQPQTDAQYDSLAQQLRSRQIRYVFAHVGPLESDGTIPPDRAPNAAALAAALHARVPGLRVLAWIGQVEAAAGLPASESVNLADSTVRSHIEQTAVHFVTDLGFDGVHYDIEPIVNNNPHFLDLLTETRAALPPGAILSVVGQKWAPNAHIAQWLQQSGRGDAWWTSYYYAAVAAHVDQIAAMLYDTGMPLPQLYRVVVQQETEHILDAVRSARHPPQVLIGLPTYSGNDLWYHDFAENMSSGLQGVIAGLNSDTETEPFTGVAIYRFGLTSSDEWATYNRLWLGR